ncbi:MAG: DMT family transporter [Patescibacteria group bacterium]
MWIGLIALFIANFIGGALSPLFVKLGIREFPPITFTALRFIIATLVFLPFFIKKRERLSLKDNISLSKNSIFFSINVALYAIGLQYTTVIMSQIFYTLVPIIVGILSYFILKEKFTKNKIIGSLLAFVGIIFLLVESIQKQQSLTFGTPLGNFIIFLAVTSWSFYIVLSKRLTGIYSPITTSFYSFILTMIILGLIAPIELLMRPFNINSVTSSGIFSLLGVGIISSAVSFSLIQFGIKRTTAFSASIFQYLAPLFASITAIPILGEKPTLPLMLGGALIIFGVFYATTYQYVKRGIRYMVK